MCANFVFIFFQQMKFKVLINIKKNVVIVIGDW